ncbi:hypothetical protein HKD37_04G010021 [Glycine soja]|uniref:Uncharacterized protein n=1 Tax=Glycine soja TaxID=3848 RepID=A0A0B2QYU0_GLYSO|nr:hypothetical protein glysoja_037139 [Glycine soja]
MYEPFSRATQSSETGDIGGDINEWALSCSQRSSSHGRSRRCRRQRRWKWLTLLRVSSAIETPFSLPHSSVHVMNLVTV